MSVWYVYLLECNDGTYYCGITNNLEKRIKTHNSGKGAKYTRSRLPCSLVYHELCENKSKALKRELKVKKLNRKMKERLIYEQL